MQSTIRASMVAWMMALLVVGCSSPLADMSGLETEDDAGAVPSNENDADTMDLGSDAGPTTNDEDTGGDVLGPNEDAQAVTFSWPSEVDGCEIEVLSLSVVDTEEFFRAEDPSEAFVWAIASPLGIESPVTYGVTEGWTWETQAAEELVIGRSYVMALASRNECNGEVLTGFVEFTAR